MIEHHIVAVAIGTVVPPCVTCSEIQPHQVVALCSCGQRASGMRPHIWMIYRRDRDKSGGDLIWLTPSFNWLNDPRDPSQGSHLHENVEGVPASSMSEWPLREAATG